MTILDRLVDHAKARVNQAVKHCSREVIRDRALSLTIGNFAFEKALKKNELSFICECKKASPSKGVIDPFFPYLDIAKEYEEAGADCISVLTEPKWFLGKDEYLSEIAKEVSIPCIRKDFIVDEYMIYEARCLGASAVLLICSILSPEQLSRYIELSDSLGLSTLVETHNETEIKLALESGARMIGVNNRNLKDFSIDVNNSQRLRELVPSDVIFVSESGVKTADDVTQMRKIGVNAVLIGETLMRAPNKKEKLAELKGRE